MCQRPSRRPLQSKGFQGIEKFQSHPQLVESYALNPSSGAAMIRLIMTTEATHEITIFIDAKKYKVPTTSMTGAQIKSLAGIDPSYQLFLEESGDKDDRPIGDTEAVAIKQDMHFFAIPVTTMG